MLSEGTKGAEREVSEKSSSGGGGSSSGGSNSGSSGGGGSSSEVLKAEHPMGGCSRGS